MRAISWLLISVGVIGVIFALRMNVSLPGADVVNIHLMSERQNYLFLSVAIFIAGIVLFASAKRQSRKDEVTSAGSPAKVDGESISTGIGSNISAFWRGKSTNSKLIMIGVILAAMSIPFNWTSYYLSTMPVGGRSISMASLGVLIGCWALPLYCVLKDLPLTKMKLVIPASILVLWLLKQFLHYLDFASNLAELATSISIGPGMWFGMLSAGVLAWTAIKFKGGVGNR